MEQEGSSLVDDTSPWSGSSFRVRRLWRTSVNSVTLGMSGLRVTRADVRRTVFLARTVMFELDRALI